MNIIRIGVPGAIIGALLAACVAVRPVVDHPISGEGGLWDLDELSDPRLVHSDASGAIGVLQPIGGAVLLNEAVARARTPIFNGAHLRTGANSFARVEFAAQRARPCEIGILNLFTGNMYSESRLCSQRVETPHALVHAPSNGMAFEVRVESAQTRIIVLRGAVEVRSRTGTAPSIQIRANQEIVVGRSGTGVPGPARSTADWRRRIIPVIGDAGPRPGPGPEGDRAAQEAARRALEVIEAVRQAREQQDAARRAEEQQEAARRAREQQDAARRAQEQQEAARRAQEREKAASCVRYGQAAVADNEANIKEHCNFTGAAWHSNYGAHYNWCMAGDNWQRPAASEEEARRARLAQCRRPIILR